MTDLIQTLVEMKDGEVAMHCNRKFNELLQAVQETGGKGELKLTVKVKPSKFAMGGGVLEMTLEHDCDVKKPELSVGQSLFFVRQDGTLSRNNPAQEEMFQQENVNRG